MITAKLYDVSSIMKSTDAESDNDNPKQTELMFTETESDEDNQKKTEPSFTENESDEENPTETDSSSMDTENDEENPKQTGSSFNPEKVLRDATKNLAARGHPSTIYPPQFMPPPTLKDRLRNVVAVVFALLFIALFAVTYFLSSKPFSAATTWYLTGALPLITVFAALCACSMYPLEYIEHLNFRAIQLINIGAIINMAFAFGAFEEDIGFFIGTTFLSFGTVMFSFCAMILGPWEFMAGSPLLTIGLLLRNCAIFLKMLGSSSGQEHLNLSACPFLFIAFGFFFKKAYQIMRLPILCSDNFKFFGLILYGGSIVANAVLNILQSGREITDTAYVFTINVTSIFAFFGTCVFLLDGSRVKHHCDAILEDRYPSTMYLARSIIGFRFATFCCCVGFVTGFASTIAHLNHKILPHSFSMYAVEFIASIAITATLVLFCCCTLRPSLRYAVELKEHYATKFVQLLLAGFVLFAAGLASSGSLILVLYTDSYAIDLTAIYILNTIPCIGSMVLMYASWTDRDAVCKIHVSQPHKWDNVYHPSNYVLLASVWLFVGSVCRFTNTYALSWVFYSWAFAVLLFHFHMAFYVWESMNLETLEETTGNGTDEVIDVEGNCIDQNEANESFDVIISGGGISGLFLACNLCKQGVSVALCERRKESITDARFAVLNSSSMEYMEDILDSDILAELKARALPESTHYGSMLMNGLSHPKARVFAAANSPPRRFLMENMDRIDDWTESRTLGSKYSSHLPLRIMQSHQEEIIKMQLSRYSNVKFFNGWWLKNFHIDNDSGVIAKIVQVNEDEDGNMLSSEQGRPIIISAKYIVGCDGPSSIIAKKLQIKFDGLLNLANTKSLLVHAPGLYSKVVKKHGNTHQYQIIRKNFGLAAIVAADPARDLWNFLFIFGKAKSALPDEICRQFLGTDNFEIKQNRSWYWNFFIAREFRKNKRAFLVGDSAHSWPPFGALGGNSAYGDVMNLGWKLALACKGRASELLLDSYTIERRQHILQTAMYVLRATPNPALMNVLTSRVFYNSLYMPLVKAVWYHQNSGSHGSNHFSQGGIQLGIKQNFSPVVMREEVLQPDDPSCEYNPSFRTGARVPYIPFPDGKSIFNFIHHGTYSILVVQKDRVDIANRIATAIKSRGVPVKVAIVPKFDIDDYQGHRREVAKLLMAEKLLIVRPDHIIAWRDREFNSELDLVEEAASKITGFDSHRHCLEEYFKTSKDASTVRSYHHWLTREFKYSLRPYKFRFPKAIPVDNMPKEVAINLARAKTKSFTTTTKQGDERIERAAYSRMKSFKNSLRSYKFRFSKAIPVDNMPKEVAIDLARAKKKSFTTTTKQGDERIERAAYSGMKEINRLSGFEKGTEQKLTPIYRLLKLAAKREANGEPVYNFAVGNPRLEPPSQILQSMSSLCTSSIQGDTSGVFKYTHPAGLIELRKYIARDIAAWQNVSNLSHENIICTPGAQSAIVNVFQALLLPEDWVLVQTPYYPAYKPVAELWGAHIKEIDFKGENFEICIDSLTKLFESAGQRLRIIALCSPSNPTGRVLDGESFLTISALAKKHSLKYQRDVWIFMDHTYWRLTYKADGVPATLPLYEQTILVSSMSKDMSLAGERFGYIVVNPRSKHSEKLSNWLMSNNDKLGNISPPSMIQHTLLDVYEKNGELPSLSDMYEERVNFMHEKLLSIGLRCNKPDGTFYLFPALPKGISDTEFADKLIEFGVLVVPGKCFGAPGYIRIAVLPSKNELVDACDLMGQVLEDFSRNDA